MSRRQKGKPVFPLTVPPAADPLGVKPQMLEHLEWMRVRQYTESSVVGRAKQLKWFADWAEERAVLRPTEVTKAILERYQRWLFHYRKKDGQPLGVGSQMQRLTAVRVFFRWLARDNRLLYNPASELEMPRVEKRLPKAILSSAETDRILNQPDLGLPLGIKDRAILETLYSTGMRRKELTQLSVFGVDAERGTVMVRLGKGKKDRLIPIGERALAWIEKYLVEVRPSLVMPPDAHVLFLTGAGEAITPGHLTYVASKYVEAAGIAGKRGACHLFRHTMATLMLEGGADIRFIQQMLGHSDLQATQIYTQVSIRKLKEVHSLTHPSAKLERAADTDEREAVGAGGDGRHQDEAQPAATREQLLSALAAEAEEEQFERDRQ